LSQQYSVNVDELPSNIIIILNTENKNASPDKEENYHFLECDSLSTDPSAPYQNNLGKIQNIGTIASIKSYNNDIAIDVTDVEAQITEVCAEDASLEGKVILFKYKIINKGDLTLPISTPITYAFVNDSTADTTTFIENISQSISPKDTLIQEYSIRFDEVPTSLNIILNTDNKNATPANEGLYSYNECDTLTTNPSEAYQNNHGKIDNIKDIVVLKSLYNDIAIDLSSVKVTDLCDQDQVLYEYNIINKGDVSFSTSTPITYYYRINGERANDENGTRIQDVRYLDHTLAPNDTIVQTDILDFRGVPFTTFIKLNTTDYRASSIDPEYFMFEECNATLDPYNNNDDRIEDLDTCKQLIAFNDTIDILSADAMEWGHIFDNDIINFSISDQDDIKLNIKNNLELLISNEAAKGQLTNSYTDNSDEGKAYFTYSPLTLPTSDTALVDSFQYKVCHSTLPDLCDSAWVFIRLKFKIDGINIPQGFMAGEGKNWEIPNFNSDLYPNSELKIFNRWGVKVYEAAPYNSDWDGTSMGGNQLPVGTYYYILERERGRFELETGFIYLNRN